MYPENQSTHDKLDCQGNISICYKFSSPWSVISLYGLGCNIVLQLGDLVKEVAMGSVISLQQPLQIKTYASWTLQFPIAVLPSC